LRYRGGLLPPLMLLVRLLLLFVMVLTLGPWGLEQLCTTHALRNWLSGMMIQLKGWPS
jgi:hypothetical protein